MTELRLVLSSHRELLRLSPPEERGRPVRYWVQAGGRASCGHETVLSAGKVLCAADVKRKIKEKDGK